MALVDVSRMKERLLRRILEIGTCDTSNQTSISEDEVLKLAYGKDFKHYIAKLKILDSDNELFKILEKYKEVCKKDLIQLNSGGGTMIELIHWYLRRYEDDGKPYFIAWGYVFGHLKLTDGIHIHTSRVEDIKMNNTGDKLVMCTRSGSEYELALADINVETIEETQDSLKAFNIPAFSLEKCQKLQQLREDEMIAKVSEILKPNELYLLQYGVLTREAYFKSADGKVINIPITSHIGMFQDSYLVTDFDNGLVDFRYYDNLWGIEPYHWSDGLEAIRIENVGRTDIEFYADTKIICKIGEVTTIEKRQYSGEGLISPDAVNGKNALFE